MKRTLVSCITILSLVLPILAWSPQGDKIKTSWAEKVTPDNVWQNYPRPQLKRTEWTKEVNNDRIHNCSATVCKNASTQPIKYFCKYFDIEKNEKTLSNFEKVLNDFTSVEEGIILLQKERDLILSNISKSIPSLILYFSKKKLIKKLGFETIDFNDLYIPIFTFQYVSAGGNSSSKCDIKLNIENLNKLISYLNDVIKWRKTIEYGTVMYLISPIALGLIPYIFSAVLNIIAFATASS